MTRPEAGWQKVQTVDTGLFALGPGAMPRQFCLSDRSNEGIPGKGGDRAKVRPQP